MAILQQVMPNSLEKALRQPNFGHSLLASLQNGFYEFNCKPAARNFPVFITTRAHRTRGREKRPQDVTAFGTLWTLLNASIVFSRFERLSRSLGFCEPATTSTIRRSFAHKAVRDESVTSRGRLRNSWVTASTNPAYSELFTHQHSQAWIMRRGVSVKRTRLQTWGERSHQSARSHRGLIPTGFTLSCRLKRASAWTPTLES